MLTGGISYFITRKAVVEKLKSRDLVIVVDSIASKIDDRIARAKETALILAKDQRIRLRKCLRCQCRYQALLVGRIEITPGYVRDGPECKMVFRCAKVW